MCYCCKVFLKSLTNEPNPAGGRLLLMFLKYSFEIEFDTHAFLKKLYNHKRIGLLPSGMVLLVFTILFLYEPSYKLGKGIGEKYEKVVALFAVLQSLTCLS